MLVLTLLDRYIANKVTQLSLAERLTLQQLLLERGMPEGQVQQIVPMPECSSIEQLANIIIASQPNLYINFNAPAHIPRGYDWEVREEDQLPGRVVGQWTWDPNQVTLYLSDRQQSYGYYDAIRGSELKTELQERGIPVFGAQLLDYLLEYPQLIPEEWKDEYIFFWGTIYRANNNILYVRYLCRNGGSSWFWCCGELVEYWDRNDPALVLASSSK